MPLTKPMLPHLKAAILIAGILCLPSAVVAAESTAVRTSLIEDIQTAQAHLSASQQRIGQARTALATELNDLEQKVVTLRERAALAQRINDERTLSLQKLQQRLQQWQDQQSYQNHLLKRFNTQFSQHSPNSGPLIEQALAVASKVRQNLHPEWTQQDVVLQSGQVKPLATLRMGPTTWFWHTQQQRGGFAVREQGMLHEGFSLAGYEGRALAQLYNEGEGTLAIDPSLKHASQTTAVSEGQLAHIARGGLWAVPIMGFALFALTIALTKAWQLWRLPKVKLLTRGALMAAISSGKPLPTIHGAQADLLTIAQQEASGQARDDQLFNALQITKQKLERFLGAIAVTASVAPLLGLLGTVSGMIETFKMMTLFGAGDPQVVSGGISQALITTELGLIVAIPALVLNALLSRVAKRYYEQLEQFALCLSEPTTPTTLSPPSHKVSSPAKTAVPA